MTMTTHALQLHDAAQRATLAGYPHLAQAFGEMLRQELRPIVGSDWRDMFKRERSGQVRNCVADQIHATLSPSCDGRNGGKRFLTDPDAVRGLNSAISDRREEGNFSPAPNRGVDHGVSQEAFGAGVPAAGMANTGVNEAGPAGGASRSPGTAAVSLASIHGANPAGVCCVARSVQIATTQPMGSGGIFPQ